MKALRAAILVLVLLMAASLVNSAYLTARCGDWTAQLDTVTAAASGGDWDTAAPSSTPPIPINSRCPT